MTDTPSARPPLRVLHLLDAHADFQTARAALYLSRDLRAGFDTLAHTIGSGGTSRNVAQAAGALLRQSRKRTQRFDLVHAWGTAALAAAALGSSGRIIYTPAIFPSRRSIAWLNAVIGYRDVQVVCPTATLRRRFVEHGIPLARCHLIRPGVEFAKIRRRRDPQLRRALGLAEDDCVLLMAGESTRPASHINGVWAGSILHQLDPAYRVLLWGRGDQAAAAVRFARQLHMPQLVRHAEGQLGRELEFEDFLPAADVVIIPATQPVPVLPVCIAMAAAIPIVAAVSYTISELLEDRHTALITGDGSPRAIARRILDLRGDSNLQWAISDMARTEAYEFFSITRFLSQHRELYTQFAGGHPVIVPETAPGPGLRFHGRG